MFKRKKPSILKTKSPELTRKQRWKSRQRVMIISIGILVLLITTVVSQISLASKVENDLKEAYVTSSGKKYLNPEAKSTLSSLDFESRFLIYNRAKYNDKINEVHTLHSELSQINERGASLTSKGYYHKSVSTAYLDALDRQARAILIPEKYDQLKNKIDQVTVWIAQTSAASSSLKTIYNKVKKPESLTTNDSSMASVDLKLVKNLEKYRYWKPKVSEISKLVQAQIQKVGKAESVKNAKALDDIKSKPLTSDDFTKSAPIIVKQTRADFDEQAELVQLGLTGNVIFLNKSKSIVTAFTQDKYGFFHSDLTIQLSADNSSAGQYTNPQIITSSAHDMSGNSAALITAGDNAGDLLPAVTADNYRQYFLNDSYDELGNTDTFPKHDSSVFWFRNNPSLTNSILVSTADHSSFLFFLAASSTDQPIPGTVSMDETDLSKLEGILSNYQNIVVK